MESKQILEILKQFNGNNTYKKIFINGAWGIGKSYYTNKYKNENEDYIIYTSLFGKTSFEAIVDSLSNELLNKLNNVDKFKKKTKNIAKKIQGSISIYGVSISSSTINNKTLFEEFEKLLEEKELIIIIDDLERKSVNVPIEDIMGLIEQFSLLEKIKIVIIGDETNISPEDREKWQKFKEKIIEKEYKIICFSYEAIESIVIHKLEEYISKEKLFDFVLQFLSKHKTSNLRTINKGINLFMEIYKNYLHEKYDEDVYLSILKSCMAVAIEYTEELYKPNEEDKNSKDSGKSWSYSIDKDIPTRIISHYFGSIFINDKDSSLLSYVISIYNGNVNNNLINEFNDVLKKFISMKDGKNIFYLSEKDIIKEMRLLYKNLKNNSYNYSTLKEFLVDIKELLKWNKELELKLDEKTINEKFNDVLFSNYYSLEKNQYDNTIDTWNIDMEDVNEIKYLVKSYNDLVTIKYAEDKIKSIIETYNSNMLDVKCLDWLKTSLIQTNSENIKKMLIKCCKENNFLIPNLNCEIDDNAWRWTHTIWGLFYNYMSEEDKNELNYYSEKLKTTSNIVKYRINCLQKYKPLISKKEEE